MVRAREMLDKCRSDFGAICDGSGLSGPTWQMLLGVLGPPYIRPRFGLDMRGADQHGRIGMV